MSNTTLNYLYATSPPTLLCFSGAVGSSSMQLNGSGGQSGDGFPVIRDGNLLGLSVWDGTILRTDSGRLPLSAGDRISVYCQNDGSDFTVKVRVNGISSSIQVTEVPYSTTLMVTVELSQNRGSIAP